MKPCVTDLRLRSADVDLELALYALGLAGVTAIEAMRRLGTLRGKTLVVSGATGGVGAVAVEIGRKIGADVVALNRGSPSACQCRCGARRCRRLGVPGAGRCAAPERLLLHGRRCWTLAPLPAVWCWCRERTPRRSARHARLRANLARDGVTVVDHSLIRLPATKPMTDTCRRLASFLQTSTRTWSRRIP
jgi:hypothetical protein